MFSFRKFANKIWRNAVKVVTLQKVILDVDWQIAKKMIAEKDKPMFERLREVAKRVVPSGGQVWLYGSRARGEARADSDWDILILLSQNNVTSKDEDEIAYPFVYAGWQNDSAVSPQLYTFDEWRNRDFTFYYQNVEHDKIQMLWA